MKKITQLVFAAIIFSMILLFSALPAYADSLSWNLTDNQAIDGRTLNVNGSTDSTDTIRLSINGQEYSTSPSGGAYQFVGVPLADGENQVRLTASNATLGPINVYSFEVPHKSSSYIIVDKSDFRLYLVDNGIVTFKAPVATGTPKTPTPAGFFMVGDKLLTSPNCDWGARRLVLFQDGVGKVKQRIKYKYKGRTRYKTVYKTVTGFRYKGYNIHGTNRPNSIGTMASHGCVRMYNQDVIRLYDMVGKGLEVFIIS